MTCRVPFTIPCLLAIAIVVLARPENASATPDAYAKIRVIPLGANVDSYFYLRVVEYNGGTHYRFDQSLTLFRCDITTLKTKDKITIRESRFVDTTTNHDWEVRESKATTFNLAGYLREHKVVMAFPDLYAPHFEIADRQLVQIHEDGTRNKLLLGKRNTGILSIPEQTAVPRLPDELQRAFDGDPPIKLGDVYWVSARDGKKFKRGYLVVFEIDVDGWLEHHECVIFVPEN